MTSPSTSAARGAAAEALAARHLEAHGLQVIGRNLACQAGELDLVCLDRGVLVIVEVRQRSRADFGGAAASVDWRKRRRLIRAAAFHWQRRPDWRARIVRFDVVGIAAGTGGGFDITWLRDAFRVT
jgi:putative endonuclease